MHKPVTLTIFAYFSLGALIINYNSHELVTEFDSAK